MGRMSLVSDGEGVWIGRKRCLYIRVDTSEKKWYRSVRSSATPSCQRANMRGE
jgi:hypothetical protein